MRIARALTSFRNGNYFFARSPSLAPRAFGKSSLRAACLCLSNFVAKPLQIEITNRQDGLLFAGIFRRYLSLALHHNPLIDRVSNKEAAAAGSLYWLTQA